MATIPTITDSTNITLELWNDITAIVLERALACGYGFNVSFGARPSATPLAIAAGADIAKVQGTIPGPFVSVVGWQFWTILDWQIILQGCVTKYFRDDVYPDGYNGQTDIGAYYESVWMWDSMSAAIGHPTDTSSAYTNTLWRRRRPRRIHFLNQTKSTDEVFGITLGNCVAGDKAEYFASGVTFRGVYEYQGGGVWLPAPSGSVADIMDSNEPYLSSKWIAPAQFQVGDIFDWYLFENVVEVCKRLNWVDLPVETYVDGNQPKYRRKEGYINDDAEGITPGGTKEDAVAMMSAATPTLHTEGVQGWPGRWSRWYNADTSEPPYNVYECATTDCKIGVHTYKGMAHEIIYYGQPDEVYWDGATDPGNADWFHPQGSSVVYGEFSVLKTKAQAAGADEFTIDYEDMWAPFVAPTYWLATNPGGRRGFELRYLHAIVKYDFVWTP